MRTSTNIVRRALNEITMQVKNDKGELVKPLASIGYKRLIGMTTTAVAIPTAVVEGAKALYDVTEDENTVVILNEEHEFYRRFYQSTEITPVLVQAMDSLFWALANAELNSISEPARRNFEELRLSLSNSLKHLAKELPDVE
jgi:predicted HAD superfamily phosphohydrolase